ncbi:MAG: DUF4915 domain-containing protein [Armatimonadota bacterium]
MPRLLVTNHSTTGDGGIYLLDTGSGALRRLYDQPTHGITRGPDGFYFVEHHGDVSRLEPGTWKVEKRAETRFDGCHDLRRVADGYFLVASRGNRVVRLNDDLTVRDVMQIVPSEADVCHPNCLIEANGELLLCVFTLTPGPRNKKNRSEAWQRAGKILRLDWERKTFDVKYEPLSQPHSLLWHEGRLYWCESFSSEVSVLPPGGFVKQTLCRLHGFVRGLQFHGGSAFVGISENKIKPPLFSRLFSRYRVPCGVVELDAATWKPRRSFQIPGKQVYELLLLDD